MQNRKSAKVHFFKQPADCCAAMKNNILKSMLLIVSLLLFTGCGSGDSKTPTGSSTGYLQTGIASYYGGEYHNRPTASGERFNKNALTAAHRTLDFGTYVQVTHFGNGRRVTVKINDRVPFVESRIIDLSERAASDLGMLDSGLAEVGLEIVAGP